MAYLRQQIRDFRGGLNTNDLPSMLFMSGEAPNTGMRTYPAQMQFPTMLKLLCNKRGRLSSIAYIESIIGSQSLDLHGLYRFVAPPSTELIVAAVGPDLNTFDFDGTPNGPIGDSVLTNVEINMQALYGKLFYTDGAVYHKYYGSGTYQEMGIVPPSAPVTPTIGGSGLLQNTGMGQSPYTYYVTYLNADGTESNPSPVSVDLTGVNNNSVDLSAIPVSADAQVTGRNIYREGGTSSEPRLVAPSPVIADNTTTTYNDNIPDVDLQLVLLSFAHDKIEVGPTYFYPHKNRLWSAGDPNHPNRVRCSSFEFPEYWPEILETPVVDGGYFTPQPDPDDQIVGYGSTGSTLMVFNQKTTFAIYGDSFDSGGSGFASRKISDRGCATRKSIVTCMNQVFFMGNDGQVYMAQDGEPTMMSGDIEASLLALTPTQRSVACAAYVDQRYVLFIPQAQGSAAIGFAYDFRNQAWIELTGTDIAGTTLISTSGSAEGGELWFQTQQGYTDSSGAYRGVRKLVFSSAAYSNTDGLLVSWASPEFEFSAQNFTNRAKRLRIEGEIMPFNGGTLTATVTARTSGRSDIVHNYVLPQATGVLIDTSLHSDLVGRSLQITLSGTIKSCQINSIELQYTADMTEG